jgi:large subunit ribosomal protein L18
MNKIKRRNRRKKGIRKLIHGTAKKNREGATVVGEHLAKQLAAHKIKEAVFDRNGYPYHGLVKEVCEGIRKGGLKL